MEMHAWRLFYWTRLLLILFAVFIAATAALDVSLASAEADAVSTPAAVGERSELTDVDVVVHEGGTDKVGGWLSRTIEDGLNGLEELRLAVREAGSGLADAMGL